VRAEDRAPGTLPRPLSSFVGREEVLADLEELLRRSRLLTLTGPGGSGKTRLGIELASRVAADYADGTHFVPLAAIHDPDLVPSAIARALGLQDPRRGDLADHLANHLGDRRLMLVLDNFEQLLPAAPVVAELLSAGGTSRVLVTSRSPLHLSGEQEFAVPPLSLPDPGAQGSADSLVGCESTSLFLTRARAVMPHFTVDEKGAGAIVAIVRRLDGLPLAIELAAARVKLLPPASLLARLDDSLGLLVGGSRDLPDRQQTLRNTIAWSYDLLGGDARRLLAVLAAFRGSVRLTDLEAVCSASVDLRVSVLDAAQELLDQSLLRLSPASADPRYSVLETVREFASERLAELPEVDLVHAAHAATFAALAERLERPPIWPDNDFLALLDSDHDNLRAALGWLQEHDPPAALRMAGKLTAFWSVRGHFGEGRRRLADLIALVPAETPDRVAALNGAGWLAHDQGELQLSVDLLDESVRLARAIHDLRGEGTALINRARAALSGRALAAGDADIAAALSILRPADDDKGVAAALLFAGLPPQFSGDLDVAVARFSECVALAGELGLATLRARALQLLGIARLQRGEIAAGRAALAEAVPVVVASGDRFGIAVALNGLILLSAVRDRPRLALQLTGVLDEYARVNEVALPDPLRDLTETYIAPLRTRRGTATGALRAEGRLMPLETAVDAALSGAPERPWRAGLGPELSGREVEVAALVATGLTNRQIAARLQLSVRTVDVHVDHVFGKLGVSTRSQLTAWVHQQGLAPGERTGDT
jgi:predicted ATPase/DNA-binding CsgD family transcriptional regulator